MRFDITGINGHGNSNINGICCFIHFLLYNVPRISIGLCKLRKLKRIFGCPCRFLLRIIFIVTLFNNKKYKYPMNVFH